jgi:hypothetical protein
MSNIVPTLIRLPREQLRPAWRAAVLAYRRTRQAGYGHHVAHARPSPRSAQVLPEMSKREAVQEVIAAVAYATREHTVWFWRGVAGR